MKSTYEFKAFAECPIDGERIEFAITVAVEGMVNVEDILERCKRLTASAIMQEPFTEKLAALLEAEVTTIGTHSGVKITCWA